MSKNLYVGQVVKLMTFDELKPIYKIGDQPNIVPIMMKYFGTNMTITKIIGNRSLRFFEDNGNFSWSVHWVTPVTDFRLEKELFEL